MNVFYDVIGKGKDAKSLKAGQYLTTKETLHGNMLHLICGSKRTEDMRFCRKYI